MNAVWIGWGFATEPSPSSVVTVRLATVSTGVTRSEEHTSELQSRFDLVCRLLLEKKKNYPAQYNQSNQIQGLSNIQRIFFLHLLPHQNSTPLPYTTLFRSMIMPLMQ